MKKVLFIGLGSIGQRHLKNLWTLEKKMEVHALRGTDRLLDQDVVDLIAKSFRSFDEIDATYDWIFITNPSIMHYETLKHAVKHSKKIFLEKPVFCDWQADIQSLLIPDDCIVYVAAPLRHTKLFKYIKEKIDLNNVYGVRTICSSYLPEWRPDVNYKDCYSSKKSMGGDVELELIHEWDYIIDLFGIPQAIQIYSGKYSNLEIDSNDIAIYIAQYRDKLVSLHLDYFGRYPQRFIEIYSSSDLIVADFINQTITYKKKGKIISLQEPRDEYQKRELEYFINLSDNDNNINSISNAINRIRIAKGMV